MRQRSHLQPEWWNNRGVDRGSNTGDRAIIGVRRMTAFALAAVDLDIVHRGTVRALLPSGRVKLAGPAAQRESIERYGRLATRNATSSAFKAALKQFEDNGWIVRGSEFVMVKDRESLRQYGCRDAVELPEKLLQLESAIDEVWRQINESDGQSDKWVEQRRKEILALMALMNSPVTGANRSGKGSVRFVPRGRVV